MQTNLVKKHERSKMALTVAFAVICIVYVLPILIVLMNSFKSNAAVNTETFALPNENSFVGLQNYIKGMTFGNYPFIKAVLYLGFGAGLAVFMFSGFVKSIPLEIEEAAAIDGCGPLRTFFLVVLPMMKPTFISVGVLEIMWVWNDFLLPYLVLDRTKYMTIPIVIQHLKGSYGQVDMGATMALILLSILPVIVFYLCCQKHIIKGVAAGAVKG